MFCPDKPLISPQLFRLHHGSFVSLLLTTCRGGGVGLFFFTVSKVHTDIPISSNFKFYIWLLGLHKNVVKPQSSQDPPSSVNHVKDI